MERTTVYGQYHDGSKVEFTVEYSIKLNELLLKLADRASRSKSGKASANRGAITVKVIAKRDDKAA